MTTIRSRSDDLGFRLMQLQRERAWPGASTDDTPFIVSDAIANLLIFASVSLGEDPDDVIRRATSHVYAELGEEGDLPA